MNLRIYCQFEVLDWVLLQEDDLQSAFKLRTLLEDHADVIVDLTEEEILQRLSTNPFLKQLHKRAGKLLIGVPEFSRQIDAASYSSYSKDIILVEDEEQAKYFSEKLGLLAISKDNFDRFEPYMDIIFTKRIQANDMYGSADIKGWNFLLKEVIHPICNSAVVIDNHVLKSQSEYNLIKQNLIEVLSWLAPRNLEVPFHLSIIIKYSDYIVSNSKGKFLIEVIKDEVISFLSGIGVTDPRVEIIVHSRDGKAVHDRYLISNHFNIIVGYGFNLFNEGIGQKNSTVNVSGNYNQTDFSKGDCTYQMMWAELASQKNTFSNFSNSRLQRGTEKEFIYSEPISNTLFD